MPPEDAGKDLRVNLRITSPYPDPPPAQWRSDVDFELLDGSLTVRAFAVSGTDNETLWLPNVTPGWYYINAPYFTTTYADSNLAARYSITLETGTSFGVGYITGRAVNASGNGLAQVRIQVYEIPHNHNVSFPLHHRRERLLRHRRHPRAAHVVLQRGGGPGPVRRAERGVRGPRQQGHAATADAINVTAGSAAHVAACLSTSGPSSRARDESVGDGAGECVRHAYNLAGNRRATCTPMRTATTC